MSAAAIPLKRRLLIVGIYAAVTFFLGSLIFYLFAEGEVRKYYEFAVALFPAGFVIFGLGNASVAVGWTAYALCLFTMLGFASRNVFRIACWTFTILILVNLFGCAMTL